MIVHFLEGYKGSGGEGISMMSVMLVSYEQGAKGDKRVSYYNMTLWSYSVYMLHVMGGGRASSLYRHPVRESRIWGTVYTGYPLRGYIGYTGYTGYTVYGYNFVNERTRWGIKVYPPIVSLASEIGLVSKCLHHNLRYRCVITQLRNFRTTSLWPQYLSQCHRYWCISTWPIWCFRCDMASNDSTATLRNTT